MSSRFKTIRSNRKWMIKSKVPPPSLSDCHFLSPSPFISSPPFQRLSLSVHPSLHHPLCTSSLLFITAVRYVWMDGYGAVSEVDLFFFLCVYLWKICAHTLKEKTIKQHNYHCRRNQKQLPVLLGSQTTMWERAKERAEHIHKHPHECKGTCPDWSTLS